MSDELDQKAYQMFGVSSYDQLSAFGKRDVRMALHTFTGVNMDHIDIVRALASSQKENEELRKELQAAWEENEDLKLELMEVEDASRTTRSSRRGERRSSESISDSLPGIGPAEGSSD